MSGTHLNDLSKVYLDQVAKVKKAETEADIQRWEDLGGPTPENYKPLDDSAKIKTEGYESTKKKEVLAAFKRDPKVRKRFEKAAKKEGGPGSDKNRAADDMLQTAKDIAKKKGDTSKSDDRYAYESVVTGTSTNAAGEKIPWKVTTKSNAASFASLTFPKFGCFLRYACALSNSAWSLLPLGFFLVAFPYGYFLLPRPNNS